MPLQSISSRFAASDAYDISRQNNKEMSVNYYPHHIGDYLKDTVHLSMLEDAAYRRMLDIYYSSEKPLPLDLGWLCRLVRAFSPEERAAVEFVRNQFFEKYEDGWRNQRADKEIKLSYKRAKVARANGKMGGRPKTRPVFGGLANETQTKPDGKLPYTNPISHIPIPKEKKNGSAIAHAPDPSPVVEKLPLKSGGEFEVRQSLVAELEPLYPNVDVPATLKEMRGWLLLNENRRKTRTGVKSFIGRWLQTEQEKHGG